MRKNKLKLKIKKKNTKIQNYLLNSFIIKNINKKYKFIFWKKKLNLKYKKFKIINNLQYYININLKWLLIKFLKKLKLNYYKYFFKNLIQLKLKKKKYKIYKLFKKYYKIYKYINFIKKQLYKKTTKNKQLWKKKLNTKQQQQNIYIIIIKKTKNNLFLNLTNIIGNSIIISSCGQLKIRTKKQKKSKEILEELYNLFLKKCQQYNIKKIQKIYYKSNYSENFQLKKILKLFKKNYFNYNLHIILTYIKTHNGIRKKKLRKI